MLKSRKGQKYFEAKNKVYVRGNDAEGRGKLLRVEKSLLIGQKIYASKKRVVKNFRQKHTKKGAANLTSALGSRHYSYRAANPCPALGDDQLILVTFRYWGGIVLKFLVLKNFLHNLGDRGFFLTLGMPYGT